VDTIEWRHRYKINQITESEIAEYVRRGVAYTGGIDKKGRAIIYIKIGRNEKGASNLESYQKLLLYTIER
jgi:hypothetical protein